MNHEEVKEIENPEEGNPEAETDDNAASAGKEEMQEKDSAEVTDFTGETLKDVRERLGKNLEEIYLETKIRIKTLEDLENEEFEALPPEVYVKGFVKSYAKFLNLDPKITADIYMEKLHSWKFEKRQRHNLPFRLTRKKG